MCGTPQIKVNPSAIKAYTAQVVRPLRIGGGYSWFLLLFDEKKLI
jgi:hypothetical protein